MRLSYDSPALPTAIIFASITALACVIIVVSASHSSHRFVHMGGEVSKVLDSRNGCVWKMSLNPPVKACPGDPPTQLQPGKARLSDIQEELTPDSFMKGRDAQNSEKR